MSYKIELSCNVGLITNKGLVDIVGRPKLECSTTVPPSERKSMDSAIYSLLLHLIPPPKSIDILSQHNIMSGYRPISLVNNCEYLIAAYQYKPNVEWGFSFNAIRENDIAEGEVVEGDSDVPFLPTQQRYVTCLPSYWYFFPSNKEGEVTDSPSVQFCLYDFNKPVTTTSVDIININETYNSVIRSTTLFQAMYSSEYTNMRWIIDKPPLDQDLELVFGYRKGEYKGKGAYHKYSKRS